MGAIAERGRVFPAMIVCFVWMTLVYCPLAYLGVGALTDGPSSGESWTTPASGLLAVSVLLINMFAQAAVRSRLAVALAVWLIHGCSDVAVKKS